MRLDGDGESRELDDLVVGEDACVRLVVGQVEFQVRAVGATDDLLGLVPDAGADQLEPVLGDDVRVRLDHSRDDRLALAEDGLDDDAVGLAGARVGGEVDARTLRRDHLLDDHGDGRLVGDVRLGAVGDDPLAEQRRPAVHDALQQILLAARRW